MVIGLVLVPPSLVLTHSNIGWQRPCAVHRGKEGSDEEAIQLGNRLCHFQCLPCLSCCHCWELQWRRGAGVCEGEINHMNRTFQWNLFVWLICFCLFTLLVFWCCLPSSTHSLFSFPSQPHLLTGSSLSTENITQMHKVSLLFKSPFYVFMFDRGNRWCSLLKMKRRFGDGLLLFGVFILALAFVNFNLAEE